MTAPILTERLELSPMTAAFMRASLDGKIREAEGELKIVVPAGWPKEARYVLSLRLRQLDEDPSLEPWLLRAMVLPETRAMVGHIGFHTAPGPEYLEPYSPGAVEFGFTVYPPFRRQGYAREAAIAMMDWARRVHGVTSFVLCISPDNAASQGLAAQLGFVAIGSHLDEMDGPEDVLELKVSGGVR